MSRNGDRADELIYSSSICRGRILLVEGRHRCRLGEDCRMRARSSAAPMKRSNTADFLRQLNPSGWLWRTLMRVHHLRYSNQIMRNNANDTSSWAVNIRDKKKRN
jgi:hypothetical protein